MATTNGNHCGNTNDNHVTNGIGKAKKPRPVLARTWSDNYDIQDVEVPGTPKTPRTSTTPGIFNFNFCHLIVCFYKKCWFHGCQRLTLK